MSCSREENGIKKARKKPVVIEYIIWNGMDDESGMGLLLKLLGDSEITYAPDDPHIKAGFGYTPCDGTVTIPTLEGTMTAHLGDYIIKGVKGELYPCKPDIFVVTYDLE
jgi:hypothetical protein